MSMLPSALTKENHNQHIRAGRPWASAAIAAALCAAMSIPASAADFPTTVTGTRPLAYYRLDAANGKSEVGATTYTSMGGVTSAQPGVSNSPYAQFNGRDGFIVTTQAGGVGTTASMMAWVNLASLPSTERHFFYVAGESQSGNDLDMQFENDNVLRFYTASGGNLAYAPPAATLVNQWHMIVVTMDAASQSRAIYWDGKSVATDKGGGRAGKTGIFSIGASTVFGGRFFNGGIDEVALWNRALSAAEVASIYAAAPATGTTSGVSMTSAAPGANGGSGGITTTAQVEVGDEKGPVKLRREEEIAIMFLSGIQQIESDCQDHLKQACTMAQVMSGVTAPDRARTGHLKFDPKMDPNYTYTINANGLAYEAHATAKKPGLIGFYWMSRSFPTVLATYNRNGTAQVIDTEIGNRSISGDSFQAQ